MANNNSSTGRKLGLVFLGATLAVAGAALYLYVDDNAREAVEGKINREKAKFYVRHNLNGSDALVKAVDNLSDSEINTIVKLADKAGNAANSAESKLSGLVDKAKDATNEVSDRVSDYFN